MTTLALPRARPLSYGHAAAGGGLVGLAVDAGGTATGLSPTTTIITGLITTMGAVLVALVARVPLGRRRRGERPDPDGEVATVPLEAFLAMRDEHARELAIRDARISDLEAQLRAGRRAR